MRITFLILAILAVNSSWAVDLGSVAAKSPEVTLLPVYHSFQTRPCQYYGFSFDDNHEELKRMREVGATCVGAGRIWNPVQDPTAPNGDGYRIEDDRAGGMPLAQTFVAEKPFTLVAVCAPTYFTADSGLTLTLYRLDDKGSRVSIASRVFPNVVDNSWPALEFAAQPAGKYLIEAADPTGSGIGLWAVNGDRFPGEALVKGQAFADLDFLLRIRYEGDAEYTELIPPTEDKIAVRLGKTLWESIRELGMQCSMLVGDWNNGLFPYYPDWYYEKYPDFCMLDQDGKRVEATMFDKPKGWPPIDHPQQIEGCMRFTTAQVSKLRGERIPMWVMGGEELYPTYCFPDRWADYQSNAVTHFREFCRMKYGDISKLNAAWGTNTGSFEEIEPPKTPAMEVRWADWIDHRFRAMQERFVWLYQAIMRGDTSRLALTPNHGDIYQSIAATRMGIMPEMNAAVSDGFETGQIISDGDPYLYNLMYTDSLSSLGKPVSPNRLAYKFTNPKARGGGTSYTPEAARRYTYESLGTGAWFLGLIQWRGSLPDGEWGVEGTPAVPEIRKLFGELKTLAPYLEHMYPVKPKLGVYLSRYTWSLIGFDTAWNGLHVGLVERHVPKAFLYDDSDWSGYPVILSVNNPIISERSARRIRQYVENGGTLIIAGKFGEQTESLRPFEQAILGKSAQVTQIPGMNAWTAKIGKGMVIWVFDDPKTPLADAVARLMDDLEFAVPTIVAPGGMVTREREIACTSVADVPIDLSTVKSVGQTFVSPGDLRSVRFSTPTYTSKPGGIPLTARVLSEGTGGEVLAEKTIPADELTDNSTHEITVREPVSAGTRLYLEIESPSGLPKERLGVWAAKENWYSLGDAYIDGKRQPGDLQFWARYRDEVTADFAVEAFALTDGLNYAQVLVNTAASEAPVVVDLRPGNSLPYHIKDVLTGKYLGRQKGLIRYPITIPAKGSAVVVAMYNARKKEADQAVSAAQSAGKRWSALPEQYATTYVKAANSAMKDGKPAKAVALASKAVSALGITASAVRKDSDLVISASITDSAGKPVTDANVMAAITPAFGLSVKLSTAGSGKYTARVTPEMLPSMYDYKAKKYVSFSGPVSIDITARRGPKIGALRIHASL